MAERKIQDGECLASIGFELGIHPSTIWKHEKNAELRADEHRNPYVLAPDDVVFIPDNSEGQENGDIDARHSFRRRGVPEKLKVQLLHQGEPIGGADYIATIDDGEPTPGKTDGEGKIEHWIPPDAKRVLLRFNDGHPSEELEIELLLGELDPVATDSGVLARLENLRLLDSRDYDEEDLRVALEVVQSLAEIPITGVIDDETRKALVKACGC